LPPRNAGRPAVETLPQPTRDRIIIDEAREASKQARSQGAQQCRGSAGGGYNSRGGERNAGVLKRRILQCCIAGALAVAACGPSPTPPPQSANELVALLRPGPATWFVGPDAKNAGFDFDLANLFAQRHKLVLKVIAASNPGAKLAAGDSGASLGAGAMYRSDKTSPTAPESALLYSSGYYAVEPVLIYNTDSYRPASWADLAGSSVAMLEGSALAVALEGVRADHPEVQWQSLALASTEALIRQVSDGTIDYAIVASNDAEALRNVHLNFERAFAVARKQELVWVFPPAQALLRDQVNSFFADLKKDGTLQRLIERYFTYAQMPRLDAGIFQERIKSVLPQYRPLFQRAQEATGIEWRLLAAIAYQESQWDTQATSETGVRGLMQLTEDTARQLGVVDRTDPQAGVFAAAKYLRDLKDKLPQRIPEPDRTWLALAAYNVGIAHLEDARVIAQKQKSSPDSWAAVSKALPLLALPEYYEDAKYGYARGGMPVAFVERVRAYYDILLAHQPSLRPRLRMFSASSDPPPARVDEPALGKR
jgi:membrane-bound lytic murein transglycosylase F